MSQTLARLTSVRHATANAIMLPHTLRALARRFPQQMKELDAAAGGDAISAAATLARRAGPIRLREVRVTAEQIGECADTAAGRDELRLTPPAPDREELLALYEAAW